MKKVIILGAGFSGLTAAWKIACLGQYQVAVYEKNSAIGGLCGYHNFNGLKLDYGPHKIYSVIPGIMDEFRALAGNRLGEIPKKHKFIARERLMDYPAKLGQILNILTLPEIIETSLSVLLTLLTPPFFKKAATCEDYCRGLYGKKIYDIVFHPLIEKIWGDPKSLSAKVAKRRIPTKNTLELLLRILRIKKENAMTNAKIILYPQKGFYDICEVVAEEIKKLGGAIELGRRPIGFILKKGCIEGVVFDNLVEEKCDLVVSSIPLNELMSLLFPEESRDCEQKDFIPMRHCIIVYFIINKPKAIDAHWIFCVDKALPFSRISEQKLLSSLGFTGDKTVLCCDFTCDEKDPIWRESDETIAKKCIRGLEELKIIGEEEVMDNCVVRIPNFYPIYESGYENKIDALLNKINRIENIISTGRLGMCGYHNTDHCLDMAGFIAQALASRKEPSRINRDLIKKSESYLIID